MNRLKELREEMNWTQDYLGNLLNVKRAAISKYENGRIPLTDDTLIKLCNIFNVSSDYILGISDDRGQKPSNEEPFADEIENLSSESKKELEKYIKLLKLKEDIDKGKSEQSATSEKDA
jgi:transcriptional regulator with XRE-family HTH domain